MKKYVILLVFLCSIILAISGSASAADAPNNGTGNLVSVQSTDDAPVANFTTQQTMCFAPLAVDFQDHSTGNITKYEWNFGDGSTSTYQNFKNPVTHVYRTPGMYTVSLKVTGPGGSNSLVRDDYVMVQDNSPPLPKANLAAGLYNHNLSVKLTATDDDPKSINTIYYTLDGTEPTRNKLSGSSQKIYSGPITISKEGITVLKFIAKDTKGNFNKVAYSITYKIDKTAPKATTSVKAGLYKVNKKITLKMNEKGSIYYTLNGSTPTKTSKKYTSTLKITSSSKLKFLAIDLAGNKSPVYTAKYVIDKTAPKLVSTSNKNKSTISKTSTLWFKFSEKIKTSSNWSKIYVKNLKTGKTIAVSKTLKNNILYLKTKTRSASTWYQVYIPGASVKDAAGNNLSKGSVYKFKTR